MIHHIKGLLIEKTPTHTVIETGGVGYSVHISLHTFSKLPEEGNTHLYTHLVVREDAHLLYGFYEREERTMFRHLIDVSGVGANTALVVLSSLSPGEVREAIVGEDVDLLKSIKGIGPRSAQRIIVDLKDKMAKEEFLPAEGGTSGPSGKSGIRQEALSALLALGFDRKRTEKTLDKVLGQEKDNISVESLVKEALKHL